MILSLADWEALALSLKLALSTTGVLLVVALPLGWWLSQSSTVFGRYCDAALTLPLVLPPTVMGFYLLELMGTQDGSGLGQLATTLGLPIAPFTFGGLVFATSLASLPFMVGPVRDGFRAAGTEPLEAAATLGASPLAAYCTVALPLARPGIVTGIVMTFAHTLGEFGIVMMVGGNLPGETRVASVQLYDHVEALRSDNAHALALVLVGCAFVTLVIMQRFRSERFGSYRSSRSAEAVPLPTAARLPVSRVARRVRDTAEPPAP